MPQNFTVILMSDLIQVLVWRLDTAIAAVHQVAVGEVLPTVTVMPTAVCLMTAVVTSPQTVTSKVGT